jgi:hypothetical protein
MFWSFAAQSPRSALRCLKTFWSFRRSEPALRVTWPSFGYTLRYDKHALLSISQTSCLHQSDPLLLLGTIFTYALCRCIRRAGQADSLDWTSSCKSRRRTCVSDLIVATCPLAEMHAYIVILGSVIQIGISTAYVAAIQFDSNSNRRRAIGPFIIYSHAVYSNVHIE